MKKIALFISGTGSNAQKIIDYFESNKAIAVNMVVSTTTQSPLLSFAKQKSIPVHILTKRFFFDTKKMIALLQEFDLIVLAGFLWLFPENIIKQLPKKIINIHPSLLPKYGGAGMYGINVHKAVLKNKEKISGITIHYVNEKYDEGEIIFQKKCAVFKLKTPEEIQKKVLKLEHRFFSAIIEKLLLK